jgi:hypothetical protein
MKRIHIVGLSPRTGTTLMAEAMQTCFDIDCWADHEKSLLSRPRGKCNIFLTKAPHDIMMVGPSLRTDPGLYVICMIRDPRDVICSIHKKDPDHYWTNLRRWQLYTRFYEKIVPHPQFIPVIYESFVSNPDKVQATIDKNIPFLKQQLPFSQYHKAAAVSNASKEALGNVRPIKPTSVGKWRNHKNRIAGQLKLYGSIQDKLIKFGYEEDDQWLHELDGVQPDLRPGHFAGLRIPRQRLSCEMGKYPEAARRFVEQKIGRRIRITHPKKWLP